MKNSLVRRLSLLRDVLPWFLTRVEELASHERGEDALLRSDYVSIGFELRNLGPPTKDLIKRFRERTLSPLEQLCETTIKQLLSLLESWATAKRTEEQGKEIVDPGPEYPRLRSIQKAAGDEALPALHSKQSRKKLSTSLAEYARTLYDLDPQHVESQTPRLSERPAASLRRLFQKLHGTLDGFWNCECQDSHEGMLLLATHRAFCEKDDGAHFSLLLGPTEGPTKPWNEVQVFVPNIDPSSTVRFAPVSSSSDRNRSSTPDPRILTVCKMRKSQKDKACLKLRVEHASVSKAGLCEPILKVKHLTPSGTFLGLLQGDLDFGCRIMLAVIFAHSFYHLCETPWLPFPWDKQAFKFLDPKQAFNMEEAIRPFLDAQYTRDNTTSNISAGILHEDQGLLALGIALLELFTGDPIESSWGNNDAPRDTDTNLYTAYRLLDKLSWDGHWQYRDAIQSCIDSNEIEGQSWGDEIHCKYVYDKVISPLEHELEQWCGFGASGLDAIIMSRHGEAKDSFHSHSYLQGSATLKLGPSSPGAEDLGAEDLGAVGLGALDPEPSATPSTTTPSPISAPEQTTENPDTDSDVSIIFSPLPRDLTTVPELHDTSSGECEITPSRISPLHNQAHTVMPHRPESASPVSSLSMFHVQNSVVARDERSRKWFDEMEFFTNGKLSREVQPQTGPIKIAILDTGVDKDLWHRWSKDKRTKDRVSYRSFVSGDNSAEPKDELDHGTHTAGLLLKVAPNARVSIARIASGDDLEATETIIEAIEYYTKQDKVDIISMSFGFSHIEKITQRFRNALRNAALEDIVLFAAGHNSGGMHGPSYPASLQECVICIGSCDGFGNPSGFTPLPTHNMFCTLGEDVPSPYAKTGSLNKTGSSYATPIAAGIAAVLMDYVKREGQGWAEDEQEHIWKVMTRAGIVGIFGHAEFSLSKQDYKILTPWKLFSERHIKEAKGTLLRVLRQTQV